jgi:uncharacterized protein
MPEKQLIILGASARAACFSARRSAYSPYWIDQYGDHDLAENFTGRCVPVDEYPTGILDFIRDSPAAPFLYTGAMENHLHVLEELEKVRPLLGNSARVCRAVRDPELLTACLCQANIKQPQLSPLPLAAQLCDKNWLIKNRYSAGGQGVMHFKGDESMASEHLYLQEFIAGENRSGVFIGDGRCAYLIGVTRQLVGEAFLNAGEFSYCGSIGPLPLDEDELDQWQTIGNTLTAEFDLKGLFGVDAISKGGDIYPLEVNPRYTASVEVLELALKLPVIAMHCAACNEELPTLVLPTAKSMIAKAYLFAGQELLSPTDVEKLYDGSGSFSLRADIPHPGTVISQGHPLMTILAPASSLEEGMQSLMERAKLLYARFEVV